MLAMSSPVMDTVGITEGLSRNLRLISPFGILCDYALDICKSLKQSDLSGTGITLSGGAAFGTSHPWARFPYDTALLLRMCWQAIPADVRYMT